MVCAGFALQLPMELDMKMNTNGNSNGSAKRAVSTPKQDPSDPSLIGLSEDNWKQIAFQADILDGLLKSKRTRKAVELAGKVLGWSTAKTYAMLKAYRAAGHAMVLAKTRSGRDWQSHLTPEQDAVIDKILKSFLKKDRGKPISLFVKAARHALAVAKIKPPSDKSIRRRFERLPERIRYAHWHGARAAADKYDLNRGSTPLTHFPLERVQMDHTPGDLWLTSEAAAWLLGHERRVALGRPTVTLVIDEFSRMVIGIHVTFGHPSIEELAEAMAIACLPKEGWLRSMGITGIDWPWFGVPANIFVDRGVDFTSTAFHRGCQKWRIGLSHRQQPHHGGIVERVIRTAMEHTKTLPGNTRFSKAARKEDRSHPAKEAQLTLKEYLAELVRYFVLEYPHRIHPALGMTPAEKWNLGVHDYGDPRRAHDPEAFYLDFLKGERRKLEKYGVKISYLDYRDRKLQPLINHAKAVEVWVKRDPADISRAFVEDPRNGNYLELSNDLTRSEDIPVAEWEKARKGLRAKLDGQKVTATGILGFLKKTRTAYVRTLSPTQQESKLNRARRRAVERNINRKTRSQERLPRKAAAPIVAVPRTMIDPAKIPLFKTSGDPQ
jgi:putative transposase